MTSLWVCQHDCLPRVSIVTRGRQCSRGVDYHVGKPTGMSYLFYYTEQPPHPRAPKVHDKLKLTNSLGQCNIEAAGLPC